MNTEKINSDKADVMGCKKGAAVKAKFEKDLYKLINKYVLAGLNKSDLVHTMEYVTQSCKMS